MNYPLIPPNNCLIRLKICSFFKLKFRLWYSNLSRRVWIVKFLPRLIWTLHWSFQNFRMFCVVEWWILFFATSPTASASSNIENSFLNVERVFFLLFCLWLLVFHDWNHIQTGCWASAEKVSNETRIFLYRIPAESEMTRKGGNTSKINARGRCEMRLD